MNDNNNYNKKLKAFARSNRNNSTKAEIKLWSALLRNKQMMGYPFLRQRPIGNYIADFFSKELKLIIEADGSSHNWEEQIIKDKKREINLIAMGFSIIRFNDSEIMNDIENVQRAIEHFILEWESAVIPAAPSKGGDI